MKKLVLVLVAIVVSQSAFAKNGGSNPVKLGFKSSAAGFASESVEHSLMKLYVSNSPLASTVFNVGVQLISSDQSVVTVTGQDGTTQTYQCSQFDDSSNSGTVIKKDVVCR